MPETEEELQKERFNLHIYEGKQTEEFLFVKLWFRMMELGNLEDVLRPDRQSIFHFFQTIAQPRITIYGLNAENEIDYLAIIEISSDVVEEKTVMFSLWMDTKKRKIRLSVQRACFIFEHVFKKFENCLAVTWENKNLKIFMKFGFKIVGCFPSIYNKDNVYSLWQTKKDFYESKAYKIAKEL
jgi:hypothetical protein